MSVHPGLDRLGDVIDKTVPIGWKPVEDAYRSLFGLADNETMTSVERSDPSRLSTKDWTLARHGDKFVAWMRAMGNGRIADHFAERFEAARQNGVISYDAALAAPWQKVEVPKPRSTSDLLMEMGVPEKYARAIEDPWIEGGVDQGSYEAALRWAGTTAGGRTDGVTGLLLYSGLPDVRSGSTGNGQGKTALITKMFRDLTIDRARNLKPYEKIIRIGYWVSAPILFDRLRQAYKFDVQNPDDGNEVSVTLQRLTDVYVLLIDDFGKDKPSDWVLERVYMILEGRHQTKITLATSNYSPRQIKNIYGTAIGSRLADGYRKLEFTAADWRVEHAVA
jgi:hypothetical protein